MTFSGARTGTGTGREAGRSFAGVVFSVYLRIYGRSVSFLHQVSIFLAGAAVSINIHLLTNSEQRARPPGEISSRYIASRCIVAPAPIVYPLFTTLNRFCQKVRKTLPFRSSFNATFLTSAGDRQTSRIERANFARARARACSLSSFLSLSSLFLPLAFARALRYRRRAPARKKKKKSMTLGRFNSRRLPPT